MKRALGWVVRIVVLLVLLGAIGLAGLFGYTEWLLTRSIDATVEPVPVLRGEDAVAEGQRLMFARGCTHCHGDNLGGEVLSNDPSVLVVAAPNLTRGRGGIGNDRTPRDIVRAVRHGLARNGRPLLMMPAAEYWYLDDRELGAMIAYLREMDAVDNTPPATEFGMMGRALLAAGIFPDMQADGVDHTAPRPEPTPVGPTEEYGAYLANLCMGCHGADFAGHTTGPPGTPPAPDLTPSGDLGDWSAADFEQAIRTGVTPDGRQLDPYMPWAGLSHMTDVEVEALWRYLQTLPPSADQG